MEYTIQGVASWAGVSPTNLASGAPQLLLVVEVARFEVEQESSDDLGMLAWKLQGLVLAEHPTVPRATRFADEISHGTQA